MRLHQSHIIQGELAVKQQALPTIGHIDHQMIANAVTFDRGRSCGKLTGDDFLVLFRSSLINKTGVAKAGDLNRPLVFHTVLMRHLHE